MLQVILAERQEQAEEERIVAVHRLLWHCFPDVAYDHWFQMDMDLVDRLARKMGTIRQDWQLPVNLMRAMPDMEEAGRSMEEAGQFGFQAGACGAAMPSCRHWVHWLPASTGWPSCTMLAFRGMASLLRDMVSRAVFCFCFCLFHSNSKQPGKQRAHFLRFTPLTKAWHEVLSTARHGCRPQSSSCCCLDPPQQQ